MEVKGRRRNVKFKAEVDLESQRKASCAETTKRLVTDEHNLQLSIEPPGITDTVVDTGEGGLKCGSGKCDTSKNKYMGENAGMKIGVDSRGGKA